jgi:hypothetical protein
MKETRHFDATFTVPFSVGGDAGAGKGGEGNGEVKFTPDLGGVRITTPRNDTDRYVWPNCP